MPASYPNSPKTFTTKSDGPGNTILAQHINDLQLEITAMEQDLIAGLPAARGGTGLTSLPSAGFAPVSDGAVYVATDVRPETAEGILAAQVFV